MDIIYRILSSLILNFITYKEYRMTRPFQYDTYVKSQIGIENDYDTLNKSHLRSTVQKH